MATGTFIKSNFTSTDSLAPFVRALIATDDFNRADGALGTTPVGAKAWTITKTGPDSTNWAIVGNKAKVSGNVGVALAVINGAAQTTTVSATYEAFTGGPLAGVAFRGDATSILCFYAQNSPAGTWVVQRFTYSGGAFTSIATGVTAAHVVGQKMEVRCSGNTFTCYINGVQVHQFTDAAAGNNYGLMAFSNNTANVTNMDNFILSE